MPKLPLRSPPVKKNTVNNSSAADLVNFQQRGVFHPPLGIRYCHLTHGYLVIKRDPHLLFYLVQLPELHITFGCPSLQPFRQYVQTLQLIFNTNSPVRRFNLTKYTQLTPRPTLGVLTEVALRPRDHLLQSLAGEIESK